MNPSPSDIDPTDGPSLKRVLGLRIAVAAVVGNVIGSGIFFKPGTIAADGGHFGLIISIWVFGGVLCILGALCLAELATMLPRAGGLYVYLREAYGRPVAFLYGWSEFMFGMPAALGALSVVFVGSLSFALDLENSSLSELRRVTIETVAAISLIATMAWVNIVGVVWGGRVQLVTTVIKAAFLALVAVTPFLLIPFLPESVNPANYTSTIKPEESDLMTRIGLVLLAVMWAYNGWHGITPLAEEIRYPQRNIPLALFGGIGLLIVLYISANVAYHGVLSMQEMSAAGEDASAEMLKKLFGPVGKTAMTAVIMCSTFGAINSNLLLSPRVTFAMGRDGVFFRDLGHVHANYRTPAAAIFVTALLAILLVITVAVAKWHARGMDGAAIEWELAHRIVNSLREDSIFTLLTNFVIFTASIFYSLAVGAVVVLRYRHPDWERPYRTWAYPLTPVLFLAVYAWFLARVYQSAALESHVGLVLIALGIPAYLAYQWWSAE